MFEKSAEEAAADSQTLVAAQNRLVRQMQSLCDSPNAGTRPSRNISDRPTRNRIAGPATFASAKSRA